MICRIDNHGKEVVLSHARFSDVIAVVKIWLNKDKEICFSKPQEDENE